MSRKRHPKKEVETALCRLEALGWSIEIRQGKGHAWGLVRCPNNKKDCRCGEFCQMSIYSTPRNPSRHAATLIKKAESCIYK